MALDVTEVARSASLANYAVVAENLTKSYGDLTAIRELGFQIERASIFALLGPNGAGKTTTFNILTTLSQPDSGYAKVAGFDVVREASQVRQRIGVTFQEQLVDKQLNGRKLLELHGRLYGMSQAALKTRIATLAKLVDLEEWLTNPLHTYSGGMRRRLELARSLLTEPEVLFLDEPTTGLDPQNRSAIWEYLQNLRDTTGLTVIFSTHYIEEAERVADKVAIIDGGQIVTEGTPAALVSQIGAEAIRLEGLGDFEKFSQVLNEQAWVTTVHHEKLETQPSNLNQPNAESSSTLWRIEKSAFADNKSNLANAKADSEIKPDSALLIGVTGDPARWLKAAIDIAEQSGFNLATISAERPNLNDVFLKYTGKRIRN